MKRDWKLIRAILLNEPTENWPEPSVDYHQRLCADAGYILVDVLPDRPFAMGDEKIAVSDLTFRGHDVADLLRNADHLNAALARLDSAKVGHSSEILFGLLSDYQPQAGEIDSRA